MSMRVGSIGSLIEVTVTENGAVLDLSEATVTTIRFRKPDGSTIDRAGIFTIESGADGKLQYTTVDGDIDQAGLWRLQALLTFPDGYWPSTPFAFEISPNL